MEVIPEWLTRDLLEHRGSITPTETALTDPKYEKSLSFQELHSVVNQITTKLKDAGVKSGSHVGIGVSNQSEFILLVHALIRLSAVIVPLNTNAEQQTLNQHISHADVSLIVANEHPTEHGVEPSIPIGVFSTNNSLQNPEFSLDHDRNVPITAASKPDQRQVLMFTSGTTGTPKAVSLTKQNLVINAIASGYRLGFSEMDSWLSCLPMYHMGGFAPIIRSLVYGNELVIQQKFDTEQTLELIDAYKITGLSVVPTMVKRFLEADWTPPNHLRIVLVGGAPLLPQLREQCNDNEIPVFPTYGLTETASQIATARPQIAFTHKGTSGNPILFTNISILDSSKTPVDTGNPGEIVVDGPTVTTGYYNNPTATRQSFSKYGFHTGDTGYLDEHGRLWVTGRIGDEIITGGKNVNPQEIRAALKTHPGVQEAFVIGIPDEEWGERIGAVVVTTDSLSREELTRHCRSQLAGFKIPRTIEFVDSLPRTKSGTVNRETILEILKQ